MKSPHPAIIYVCGIIGYLYLCWLYTVKIYSYSAFIWCAAAVHFTTAWGCSEGQHCCSASSNRYQLRCCWSLFVLLKRTTDVVCSGTSCQCIMAKLLPTGRSLWRQPILRRRRSCLFNYHTSTSLRELIAFIFTSAPTHRPSPLLLPLNSPRPPCPVPRIYYSWQYTLAVI